MKPYALLCLLVILFCVGCEQAEIPIADSPKCDGEKCCKCGCPDGPCFCTDCEKCGKKPEHKPAVAEAAIRRYETHVSYTLYLNKYLRGRIQWYPVGRVASFIPDTHKRWHYDREAEGWRVLMMDGRCIFIPRGDTYSVEKHETLIGKRR